MNNNLSTNKGKLADEVVKMFQTKTEISKDIKYSLIIKEWQKYVQKQ